MSKIYKNSLKDEYDKETSPQYDDTNPVSIGSFAKKLIGYSFEDILKRQMYPDTVEENKQIYNNKSRKGGLGNLIEKEYFKYEINNKSEPDFPKAGVELKVTPYEEKNNGELRAGERLVLGMISYKKPIENNFDDSHLWKKSKLLLLVYYLRKRPSINNLIFKINYVTLFTPPKRDLDIIKHDYSIIVKKIQDGRADELSESDTMYLGACTKGATSEKSKTIQYYPPHNLARGRAFCYKTTYMSFVLNNYITTHKETYEAIIKDVDILKSMSFEEYIVNKINAFIGKTDKDLCEIFSREYNNNKAQWSDLGYRMLGIKSNAAEEFIKANVVVKSIRIEENGTIKESISLPPFNFKELAHEEWEDSQLFKYFNETKFLFIVFIKEGDVYKLKGCQLWNLPHYDFKIVNEGWEKIQYMVKAGNNENGIIFTKKTTKKGVVIRNNLPKKENNEIIHIRPHTQKRYYKLSNGEVFGDNPSNGDELPDGRIMTKQSFWINNSYILTQLKNI